jgi:hypothetical protein
MPLSYTSSSLTPSLHSKPRHPVTPSWRCHHIPS